MPGKPIACSVAQQQVPKGEEGAEGKRERGGERGGEEEERRWEGACDHMTLIAVGCVT